MRASLTAVAVAFVALTVGCSQPVAPTGPTSLSPASPSIASSDANATGAGLLAEGHEVPFKGRWEGAVTARTPLPPGFLSISFEGTGNATHLGRFTVENRIVLNTTDRTLTGTYEFTAANGDTLTATVTGKSPLTPPGVPQTGVETATITGDGAVRQRQWELHYRARGRHCDLRGHRFLRGDDLLARCRQPLKT